MKLLYIGQYSEGTTSKMRADTLNQILQPSLFEVIDTHVPFYKSHPFWRTLAFRFKKGKVIRNTNRYILKELTGKYDLIWVDKAVFISEKVTKILRNRTNQLVHYTPDTAFEENSSNLFYKSLSYYDYVISTKSFEKEAYLKYISTEKLLYTPQGFNRKLHYSRHPIENKLNRVIFVGLFEVARGAVISALLKENIPVAIGGKNWNNFVKSHQIFPLTYLGEGLFSEAYANAISESAIGLGLVSKRFPELHTTRTFEIPACGTLLATERNEETLSFFEKDEVIFFSSIDELVFKIKYYLNDGEELRNMTKKGEKKVYEFGFDYEFQLRKILGVILKNQSF